MKKVTRWSPDTCGCVLEYEWDDMEPPDTRTVTHKKTISTCPAHTALKDKALFGEVVSENTRKNLAFGLLIKDMTREEKDEALGKYKWRFDQNRVLVIDLVGMNVGGKVLAQNALDTKFGINKVKFEAIIREV